MKLLRTCGSTIVHSKLGLFGVAIPVREIFETRAHVGSDNPHHVMNLNWPVKNGGAWKKKHPAGVLKDWD